ncbi:hypothetical protein BU17DRAFT_90845 [Hysterangium stoloniferum]|nr:hypothetical protein BU17DRAFT_90845 [Hysterangium stoloniferum]
MAIDLPLDVWIRIVSKYVDREDISSLTTLNWNIRAVTLPYLFRELTFEGTKSQLHMEIGETTTWQYVSSLRRTRARIRDLLQNDHLLAYVRRVSIWNWSDLPWTAKIHDGSAANITLLDIVALFRSTCASLTILVASLPRLGAVSFLTCRNNSPHMHKFFEFTPIDDPEVLRRDNCSFVEISLWNHQGRFQLPVSDRIDVNSHSVLYERGVIGTPFFRHLIEMEGLTVEGIVTDVNFMTNHLSFSPHLFQNIQRLRFTVMPWNSPTASTLQRILASLPNLRVLDLHSWCPPLSMPVNSLQKLDSLTANVATALDLLQGRNVHVLRFRSATESISNLSTHLSSLTSINAAVLITHLDLSVCDAISDNELAWIASLFLNLTHFLFKTLVRLSSRYSYGPDSFLTPSHSQAVYAILPFFAELPRLRHIGMSHYREIDQCSLDASHGRGHPVLETLTINKDKLPVKNRRLIPGPPRERGS